MTLVWIVGVLVVAAAAGFLLFRPKARDRAAANPATPRRESLLQIVLPATGNCCASARKIERHRFQREHAPPLPLPECSMKAGCHCRYQLVAERRMSERRRGDEQRESIRLEDSPRRKSGRRAQDNLWSNDSD